ncbi:MAG: DUF2442 domain-containing protein [Pseudomonadota bacterium]|nr:DUF2442 domain-containing protein [Pseudomonadota bacterium]MDP1903232.1 DUF2442 domain-containing protein [Pseudomonadota bacterium]MDP2352741.1 DUF2442 domain-containing protein [Pseudomonadota bacterium]
MASMKRPRLKSATALPEQRLRLEFIDGSRYTVGLAPDIERLPGLRPLQDATAFAQIVVADDGWTVEWPDLDIQIGADTLWLDAIEQNSHDEAQREFLRWRVRHALSLSAAGNALGITPRTVSAYGTGARPVPKVVRLAIKGWESEHNRRDK